MMSMKEIRAKRHELIRQLEYSWKNPDLTQEDHLRIISELEKLIKTLKQQNAPSQQKEK